MIEGEAGLPGDDTPEMTGKVLKYDHKIYGKEKMTPEDLETLHGRADYEAVLGVALKSGNTLSADEVANKVAEERKFIDEQAAAILGAVAGNQSVNVQVDVSPGVPIHCSYFPGAKTADLSVPINVTINGKMESGSISQDLTIPAALFLKTQLEDFIRNYILRVLQP